MGTMSTACGPSLQTAGQSTGGTVDVEGGLEVVDLTDLVGDLEIPCDWGESVKIPHHGPARWVAIRVRCACGYGAGPRLICDDCKDYLLHPDVAFGCAGGCGAVFAPARTLVSSIEALA